MPQLAKEFLPDARGWTNRFPIKSSSSNRIYNIAQRISDGTWGCNCMGWIRFGYCRHLTNIMPSIIKAENAIKGKLLDSGPINTDNKPSAEVRVITHVVQKPFTKIKVPVIPNKAMADTKGLVPINPNNVVKVKKPFVDLSKYKTYDVEKEGLGTPEQWRAAFEERMFYKTFTPIERKEKEKGLCDDLYAAGSYEVLRDTYYKLIREYHPDTAGDTEINRTNSQLLNDAYFILKRKFGKK